MRRLRVRWILPLTAIVTGAAIVMLASSTTRGDHQTVYGITLKLICIQANKEGKEPINFDAKIVPALKSELIRLFKYKYKSYAVTRQDEATLTRPIKYRDPGNRVVTWDIGLDKPLIVTYLDHNGTTVNLQLQHGAKFDKPSVEDGAYFIMMANEAPDPILVILQPKIMEVRKD